MVLPFFFFLYCSMKMRLLEDGDIYILLLRCEPRFIFPGFKEKVDHAMCNYNKGCPRAFRDSGDGNVDDNNYVTGAGEMEPFLGKIH